MVEICEQSLELEYPLVILLENYAKLLHETERDDEAVVLEMRAKSIQEKLR